VAKAHSAKSRTPGRCVGHGDKALPGPLNLLCGSTAGEPTWTALRHVPEWRGRPSFVAQAGTGPWVDRLPFPVYLVDAYNHRRTARLWMASSCPQRQLRPNGKIRITKTIMRSAFVLIAAEDAGFEPARV
jgi:hypothetical protein